MARRAQLEDKTAQELMAMIEVMYLVAVADGYFSAEERDAFLEHAGGLSGHQIGARELGLLVDRWEREGRAQQGAPGQRNHSARLVELAQILGDETGRRIAYGLAMEIADADGQFLGSEEAILGQIALAFGLDEREQAQITHSVRMSEPPRSDSEN